MGHSTDVEMPILHLYELIKYYIDFLNYQLLGDNMHKLDKDLLRDLLENYHVNEILLALSELAGAKASELSDWELPDSAKKWTEIAFTFQNWAETTKHR